MSDENISQRGGWNEHSMLVLSKLDSLEKAVTSLHEEIRELRTVTTTYGSKQEVCTLEQNSRDEKIEEIRVWKKEMDAVVTPTQLKETLQEHKNHRDALTKFTTTFTVIQVILGIVFALFFKK